MKYKTVGMLVSGGFNKDINDHVNGAGTHYMLSRDRSPYLIQVKAGLLVQNTGVGLHPFDTTSSSNDTFIFVMTGDGAIYSGDKQLVQHHSSFLAGREVAAAGSWVVRSGRPGLITNMSGHYQTPVDYAEQILKELKSRGVNTSAVVKRWMGGTSRETAKALAEIGVTRKRLGDHGETAAKF